MQLAELETMGLFSEQVIDYLRQRGWSRIEPGLPKIAILRKNFLYQEEEIVLPIDRSFGDYQRRIYDAIQFLSRHEDREPSEIIEDLLNLEHDVLRVRITGDQIGNGWMSYFDKRSVEEGLRKVLVASALFAIDPKPYYKKLHRAQAEQWMRGCRAGAPETGSYVVKIQFPMDEAQSIPEQSTKHPFSRKVSECLMTSLNQLASFVDRPSTNLPVAELEPLAFSANLCLALAEMKSSVGAMHFNFEMNWSQTVPLNGNIPREVAIRDTHFPSITKIGQQLKPPAEITQSLFIGKVLSLSGAENDEGSVEGDVHLSLLVDEESIKARASLNPMLYSIACDAHKENRYIRVSGILREQPRCSELKEVTSFEAVS